MKFRTSAILFTTILSAIAFGCEQHDITETFTFNETITALEVNADADIQVEASEDNGGTVDVDVSYRGPEPDYDVYMSGDRLKVVYKCKFDCDGIIEIKVPSTVYSVINSDSANIEVNDLEGDASITADSGNIHVSNLTGELDLSADSGNISGTVSSDVCTADADSGNISLEFEETPERLDLTADSGNITVRVPSGAYNITTDVDSGDREIEHVTDDSGSPNAIHAEVDSGNISIIGL